MSERSAYDPPTQDEYDFEEADLIADLSDDPTVPSEGQREILKAFKNAEFVPTVNWDLTEDATGALPRGTSPESVRGRVRIVDFDSEGGGIVTTTELSMEGKSDPDWVAVAEKYRAEAESATITGPGRKDLAVKVMREVAERKRKRAQEAKMAADAQREELQAQEPRPVFKPRVPESGRTTGGFPFEAKDPEPVEAVPELILVRVNLGRGLGQLEVAYRDVVISGKTLTLVADPPASGTFSWVPPDPDPDDPDPSPLTLAVAGLPTPVRVFPLGLSYPYAGRVHYVLLIDRPTE